MLDVFVKAYIAVIQLLHSNSVSSNIGWIQTGLSL